MEFRVLGPLEVLSDGRALDLGGQKQRALLALLLLEANRVVSSDRLIEGLWEGDPPSTAQKGLQVYVSQLRKLLGRERLQTKAPGYVLRVDPDELDVERFRRLQAEGRLDEALALWRGPPLGEFAYRRFAQPEIARLEELRLGCLEERIERDLAGGRHAELVGELEALVKEHPLRERLRGQLMLALYRSGRQAEALDAYADARAALVEELGIEPGRELRELHQAILQQDSELDLLAVEAEPARGAFVGREAELGELVAGLDDAFAGRGRLFLLAGEPGIGKSRLAEELTAHARSRGARTLVGRCWEAGGAPAYWPWVQALRSYVRETDPAVLRGQAEREAPELTMILPELREVFPDLPAGQEPESEGTRFRLFESVSSFLRGTAKAEPLALFLDDLHAADAPSLLLLRFVAAELQGVRVLIVGCYRDTEVGPDLGEALPELTREPTVRRVALRGLSAPDTAQLLELTAGWIPTDELSSRIHAETEGNPLFAGEVGRLLAAEGAIERADGAEERLPIPEGVREAIRRRLGRQSDRCKQVLTLASVLGREFDVRALQWVSGLQQDELFGALEEAVDARLVGDVPDAPERLRFSHVLIRDTLYEDLPATRRLRLHQAIGSALEGHYAENLEPHLAELAHHFLEAGSADAEKAVGYATRAGDLAASQLAYEEAARHYTSALRVLERAGSADSNKSCELLLSLGEALSRAGSAHEAKQALQRAATLAQQAGRSDQLARAALEYVGRFGWARGSIDPLLVPLLERALAAIGEGDTSARARLLARLAAARRDDPSRDRRIALAEEGVEIARRLGDPVTLAYALEGHWVAVETPAVAGDGLVAGEQLMALGEEIGDKERVFEGHDFRFHAFWALVDRAGVEVELDALSKLADELRQPAQRWHVGTGRTMLALMEGRFERAEQLISETLALGRRAESWNAVVSQRLALFVLRRGQGRLAELEDTIRRSVHEYPALLRFSCALAHLYGELGRERDARPVFDALLSRDLAHEHEDAEWLFSMSLLPDPCAFLGDTDAAAKLYSLLLPYEHLYAQAPVEASFGSVARGLGILSTMFGRFDDAEKHFDDALEIERRMGARPWLAHAEDGYARMLLARDGPGDRERARELIDAAVSIYTELGMETWAAKASAAATR